MSIWVYRDSLDHPIEDEVARDTCLFCAHPLDSLERRVLLSELKGELKACSVCGWWCKNSRSSVSRPEDGRYYTMYGVCAQLRNLDLADISTPLQEINAYLLARFDSRFQIPPRKFEELVASVFQQSGYQASVTGAHADGGIDVVLEGIG